MSSIRSVTVDVRAEESWIDFGVRTRVRIDVQTSTHTYSMQESLENSAFAEQLRAMFAIAEREVGVPACAKDS